MPDTIEHCSQSIQELYHAAKTARGNSYAPYSQCRIGAAVRLADGSVYAGCNVENSSFGATICAERAAITRAVCKRATIEILEVMVVTDEDIPWPPCGLCRQVIAEFARDCTVHAANTRGDVRHYAFENLYPHPFGPEQMHV